MSLESVFKLSLIMNMIDNLSGPMAGVASKVGANVSKLDAASQTFGSMAKAGAAMQETGSQIVNAVLAPVEATFETRRALGELASLGVQDLEAVENAARSFSDQWAGTSKADFISAAYDIKSGIASLSDEGVAEFTSLAALTAKATKSTAGEMTSLFATGYGIYKDYYSDLSDMEFGEMFSAGISDAVRAFKTSGSGMAQAIQNLGASATTAQVPLEEQLSVLGMLQATMGGAEAGTKYKAFLRSATKGARNWAQVHRRQQPAPEYAGDPRHPAGQVRRDNGRRRKMELQKAFGDTEAVALIDLMYNKVGDLQDNIVNMYGSLGKGVSVTEQMASAIQETEPERFERLKQRIHNVTESIGNSLLPTVNDLMSKGEGVLTKVGSWIEKNQELVKVHHAHRSCGGRFPRCRRHADRPDLRRRPRRDKNGQRVQDTQGRLRTGARGRSHHSYPRCGASRRRCWPTPSHGSSLALWPSLRRWYCSTTSVSGSAMRSTPSSTSSRKR